MPRTHSVRPYFPQAGTRAEGRLCPCTVCCQPLLDAIRPIGHGRARGVRTERSRRCLRGWRNAAMGSLGSRLRLDDQGLALQRSPMAVLVRRAQSSDCVVPDSTRSPCAPFGTARRSPYRRTPLSPAVRGASSRCRVHARTCSSQTRRSAGASSIRRSGNSTAWIRATAENGAERFDRARGRCLRLAQPAAALAVQAQRWISGDGRPVARQDRRPRRHPCESHGDGQPVPRLPVATLLCRSVRVRRRRSSLSGMRTLTVVVQSNLMGLRSGAARARLGLRCPEQVSR